MDTKLIISIVSILLGMFLQWMLHQHKTRISYNIKLHEQYSVKSEEIINVIIKFVSLSFRHTGYTQEDIDTCKQQISDLYFKYYNYLPMEVLIAINCFHKTLATQGRFMFVGERLSKSLYSLEQDEKGSHPEEGCHPIVTLYKKYKKVDYVKLKRCTKCEDFFNMDFKKMIMRSNASDKLQAILTQTDLKDIPAFVKITLQARYIIYLLDKYYQRPYKSKWDHYLGKSLHYHRHP
ncbi:MAG: hypothetical protein J1F25_05925 [Prevotellaceae bacterium]|nr:hypothetical protein [Prevotellaceae bacterium]